MKKYKILSFTFSLLSLLGLVFSLGSSDWYRLSYGYEVLFDFIIIWLIFSLPLIILWIWTRIFD